MTLTIWKIVEWKFQFPEGKVFNLLTDTDNEYVQEVSKTALKFLTINQALQLCDQRCF